jgi:hypothetical protein
MTNPVTPIAATALADSQLFDTRQTASLLGLSVYFVKDHSTGEVEPTIPFVRLGRNRVRFRASDLKAFLEANLNKKV